MYIYIYIYIKYIRHLLGNYKYYNYVHEKNYFVEVSKNLAEYKSENNFIQLILLKIIQDVQTDC